MVHARVGPFDHGKAQRYLKVGVGVWVDVFMCVRV